MKKKIGSIGRFSRSASKKETKVNGGVEGGAKSADNNKMGEHKQCASIVTNIFSESNDKLINQKKIEWLFILLNQYNDYWRLFDRWIYY